MAYNLLGPEIFYRKRTWLLPVIVYGSAAVDITISVLTVEKYGAVGVAWASAARSTLSAAIAGIISCRLVKIPYPWLSMLRSAICGLVIAIPLSLLMRCGVRLLSFALGLAGSAGYMVVALGQLAIRVFD